MTTRAHTAPRAVRLMMVPAMPAVLCMMLVQDSLAQAPIIQPGAPGQPSRQISADEASQLAGTLSGETAARSGRTQARYADLADTLAGIADRLNSN